MLVCKQIKINSWFLWAFCEQKSDKRNNFRSRNCCKIFVRLEIFSPHIPYLHSIFWYIYISCPHIINLQMTEEITLKRGLCVVPAATWTLTEEIIDTSKHLSCGVIGEHWEYREYIISGIRKSCASIWFTLCVTKTYMYCCNSIYRERCVRLGNCSH